MGDSELYADFFPGKTHIKGHTQNKLYVHSLLYLLLIYLRATSLKQKRILHFYKNVFGNKLKILNHAGTGAGGGYGASAPPPLYATFWRPNCAFYTQ